MPDALILAGGSREGVIEKKFGVLNRALLVIHGKFMIEYVIEALRNVSSIRRIVVVGPVPVLQTRIGALVDAVVEAGDDPFASTLKGLEVLQTEEKVLVVTSDLPLLRAEAVRDFLARCAEVVADFYYPIVRRETYEARIGGGKRTFVCLREGCFTGGNLLLLDPKVVQAKRDWIARVVAFRKNPIAIARLLGLRTIMKLLLRRLTIPDVEERVAYILGVRGRAIITPYAEIGFDVDTVEHVSLAEKLLEEERRGGSCGG
ncbi:nucleotidyltransferase family protein [Candidatus Caldatribacterium sp.]|uniref:nucleotidyltransferase family protein n=1 Tax=Candidatus Caldatribacterium sp. TaxID=2282143 RepID=UPI00299A53A1|nr:nucleotidyltransferase family protein [Candidatus Caldatribacterium sp.]MDW8081482.1 nucleotidyltransferase family protein [Candidatus Calescibacterium sp.]